MPDTLTKADIIEAIQKENDYSREQSSTRRTDTPARYISISASSTEDSLRL